MRDPAAGAAGVSATATGALAGTSAEGAVDGQLSTVWGAPAVGAAIEFDLGEAAELRGVTLAFSDAAVVRHRFSVLVSEDASSWQTVLEDVWTSTGAAPFEYFALGGEDASGGAGAVRYVRVVAGGNSGTEAPGELRLAEAQFVRAAEAVGEDTAGAEEVVRYFGYDGQGSVRYLTDAAGAVTDTYDYDAYGRLLARTGTTENAYLYQGQQFDADLGLYYLRARYYNPETGRFWTADPFEGFADEPEGRNKYTYARNIGDGLLKAADAVE